MQWQYPSMEGWFPYDPIARPIQQHRATDPNRFRGFLQNVEEFLYPDFLFSAYYSSNYFRPNYAADCNRARFEPGFY
jgi:hypothetical protein